MNLTEIMFALRLWGLPALYAVAFVGLRLVAAGMGGTLFTGASEAIRQLSWIPALAGVWAGGQSLFKLWEMARGDGELCYVCGGPTRYISPGRYSPHHRCLRCGFNRKTE